MRIGFSISLFQHFVQKVCQNPLSAEKPSVRPRQSSGKVAGLTDRPAENRYLSFQFKIIPFWTISFWDNERNSLPKGFSRLPKTAIHIFPFLKKLSVYITPDSSIVFYSESVTVSDWNFISWNFICIVQSPSLCWGGRPTKRIKKHCIFAIL